jgi:hypothetical protein
MYGVLCLVPLSFPACQMPTSECVYLPSPHTLPSPSAASVLPNHLATILAATLPLSSQPEEREHRAPAAATAAHAVALAAGEEGLPLLVGEVVKACEEAGRAAGAAALVEGLARAGRLPLVDYADELLKVGDSSRGHGGRERRECGCCQHCSGCWSCVVLGACHHAGASGCGLWCGVVRCDMLRCATCMAICSSRRGHK